MCGIAGALSHEISEHDVKVMLTAITHRGPDEFGTFTGHGISMGTARLSIVDLSGGQQPIRDEVTGVTITLNGEIFNHIELRDELMAKGHRFKTKSDTEVALRLYLEHGDLFARHMNGQFAIAIWDPREKKLLLTRDRYGICPLFYHEKKETLAFASEMKCLLTLPNISRQMNLKALDQIFTFWTPIGSHTIFADILELTPGTVLVKKGEQSSISAYWTWPFPESHLQESMTFDYAKERLLEELKRAISLRLRADVEVGSYLSGGLDSSVIVALACGALGQKLRTYSIQFEEKSYDETPFQQMVSRLYHTKHKAFVCREGDISERFEQVVWHTECPLFRTAPTPMNILSEKVRQDGLKVVLTGEGSDEILLGYDIYKEVKLRRFCSKFPQSEMRAQLFKRLYGYLPQFANPRYANLAIEALRKSLLSTSPFYSHEIRWANNSANKIYFSESLQNELRSYNPLAELESLMPPEYFQSTDIGKAQYLEIQTLLRGYLLSSQGDRMTMGNSVESRFPFLDHELLTFVASIPEKHKLRGLKDKYVLREAIQGLLPDEVRNRSKFAYQAPEVRAFSPKGKAQSPLVEKYLSREAINEVGLFNADHVANLLNKASQSDLSRLSTRDNVSFVQILSTQILHKMFVQSAQDSAGKDISNAFFKTQIREGA